MLRPLRRSIPRLPLGLGDAHGAIHARQFSVTLPRTIEPSGWKRYRITSGGGPRIEKAKDYKAGLFSDEVEGARRTARGCLPDFDVVDKVVVITGGGRGLGLTMAQALYQAGAIVHCLDRMDRPYEEFCKVQRETHRELGGELHYHCIDLTETAAMQEMIAEIARERSRLDGCIAAAAIQQVTPALEYERNDVNKMLDINYTAVFMTAQAVAKAMYEYQTPGSILLVASMSAFVANKGLRSPVYNSSKAAVVQLARNLAMEWGHDGIRVNALCPGNILTPMVKKNFDDEPGLEELWKQNNMLNRISHPEEYRGAAIFALSDASSFMTGASWVVDGGYTAW